MTSLQALRIFKRFGAIARPGRDIAVAARGETGPHRSAYSRRIAAAAHSQTPRSASLRPRLLARRRSRDGDWLRRRNRGFWEEVRHYTASRRPHGATHSECDASGASRIHASTSTTHARPPTPLAGRRSMVSRRNWRARGRSARYNIRNSTDGLGTHARTFGKACTTAARRPASNARRREAILSRQPDATPPRRPAVPGALPAAPTPWRCSTLLRYVFRPPPPAPGRGNAIRGLAT